MFKRYLMCWVHVRYVFSWRLNMLRLGAGSWRLSGSEFQVDGPQQQNTDDRKCLDDNMKQLYCRGVYYSRWTWEQVVSSTEIYRWHLPRAVDRFDWGTRWYWWTWSWWRSAGCETVSLCCWWFRSFIIMAACQLAGRRPLYFTADVSILLLFFSPANLRGLWADRHQTLPHVRWWL